VRILVVNKFFWNKGGSERVLFDLAAGYEAAGHEVVHFSMRSPRNRPSPWERYFVSPVAWEGGGLSRLRAAARAIHSREAARCIRRLVRDARPHVAHLHNFHHQLSPSIVAALRREGVPCVHTLHDYKVICPNYLLYTEGAVCERCKGGRFHAAVAHRCLQGAIAPSLVAFAEMTWHRMRRTLERGIALFVSPSRFLRDKLVEFGTAPERIRVVPNGLAPERFRPAAEPGDGFVYAGRLSREKGLGTLVRAVARTEGVRLTVCGTGPAEADVHEAVARSGAADRIELCGHLERDALQARLRGARAAVLPSEWYENAPMSALEALASGVPVVASRIGGNPELVRDGRTGLLFDPGDEAGLARCLVRLRESPELAAELGRRGRAMVEAEYSLADQVSAMLEILQEVRPSASR
jgi:glycosyltransferase involved in cell wall biosynthesis